MPGRILVTPRSAVGHPTLGHLTAAGYDIVFASPGETPTFDQQRAAIHDCVGYLAGVEPITAELLDAAPALKAISRNGTGADAIDLDAAAARGIEVLRAPAANAQGVAELTVGLMFAAARAIPATSAALAEGRWERTLGLELSGRTLGVVGAGQIGQRVIRVALAIGMRVRAYDAYPATDFAPDGDFAFAELQDVLEQADVLTLHAPAGDRPLLDTAAIDRLRANVIVVNTARSGLVDEPAILAALDSGILRAYAADVFAVEPPGETALTVHPRFIGTSHIGGYTDGSVERAMAAAVQNLIDALDSARD